MTLRRLALVSALLVLGLRVVASLLGWEAHTSILAGMPVDSTSWVKGPLLFALHLAAWTIAPITLLALALEAALRASGDAIRTRASTPRRAG